MRRPPRIVFLLVILAGVALWIALDGRTHGDATPAAVPPSRRAVGTGSEPPALTGPRADIASRRALAPLHADPFRAAPWIVPAARPRRKAAPAAPPLPFRFVGRVYEGATMRLFLSRGDKLYSVRQGDALDGGYRIESVSDTSITFLYRPTGTRQTMRIDPPLRESAARGDGD